MRGSKSICWAFILVAAIAVCAAAQPSYIFHHLTTENGLSSSTVNAILKDSYGFLWIATESGLNRYDGYEFKIYKSKPDVPTAIPYNSNRELQEDGLGNIWIRSHTNAYTVYHRDRDNFITNVAEFLKGLGIEVDRNYKIYVDRKKDLWVLSGQKIFFYNTRNKTLRPFNIRTQLDEVTTVELSDDGEFLYGMLKPGLLWQINIHTGDQTILELENLKKPELYTHLYADSRGGLWLFSGQTDLIYYRKSPNSGWDKLVLSSVTKTQRNRVLNIMDDGNGHIWIGTDHSGLFIFDKNNEALINLLEDRKKSSSIASNNITCFYKDEEGIIWVGHSKKGISYYHSSFHAIVNVEHPDCRDVGPILEDRQGNVWLGTDGHGLFVKEKNGKDSKIEKLPLSSDVIVSLVEDQKGRIWIGTFMDGLFCYENGKFRHFTKDNSRLAGDNIWTLKEDRYGNLWIGTLGGGIQYLQDEHKNLDSLITVCEGMQYPLDFFYDDGDKLYIGTVYGVYLVDITNGDHTIIIGNARGTQNFKEMIISCIHKDKRDNIWMGHPEGLTLWDVKKDTLYFIDENSGLVDNIVQGIVEDDYGNVWVTTSNGLSVLSTERDSQGSMVVSYRNFSTHDGLSSNHFNRHAICKLRNRDILLGGAEGLSIVNPNKIVEKRRPPVKVTFTGLSVANNDIGLNSLYKGKRLLEVPMEQTDSLTFNHSDKLISIQFTAGDLLYANKVKYAYKLEGFNNQWIITPENKIVFSSLAPGNYRLYVKAANSDGVWNNLTSVLNITVTPPFYLTRWAIALYIVLGVAFILFVIYRTRKHHRVKFERQRIQFEREREVHLNEMKLRFFTNVSHDLRTPLTLITAPLQSILSDELEEGLRKKLAMISKNAEQLLSLINSLLDFRKLDAGAESLHLKQGDIVRFIKDLCVPFHVYAVDRHMGFAFSSEMECLTMPFDPDKLQKIMLNLLSNAFKFTFGGGLVRVHVFREGSAIGVSVADSGPGIGDKHKKHIFEQFYQGPQALEKTGSGIGLHIVSEYVRMHGGTITVQDNLPSGSVFTFMLPVIEVEDPEELYSEEVLEDEIIETIEEQDLPIHPVLLFVDDNKDFCEFMADSLSDEFTVLIAYNGQEAVEKLEANDVNIVVSDVMMPVINGIELCNRIKANIHWSHIPVILLTARTAEEYQLEGLETGADDYLTKPFNFNLLKLRIRKFLEWTEKCHASFSQKIDISPSEITITPLDEQLIEKAIKVVEDHIGDPDFSVEDLGEAVGLSRSHLYKKLMSITGKGPAEFIRTVRLKRGRQLLEKSQLQIAEVAYTVGFNSPKRFTINFKHEFGVSPSEYLRSLDSAK